MVYALDGRGGQTDRLDHPISSPKKNEAQE